MDNRNQSSLEAQNYASDIGNYPIKVVALGGLDEMGKNCYVIEVDNDAFIIEAGLKYPNASIPGVDIIIPDFDYIRTIAKKVRAILITHGHDDQYGALPYLLNIVRAPIYATETTIQVIKTTLSPRFRKIDQYSFVKVDPSDTVTINGHVFELFQTTHSVAESFGFALKTRFGNIVYTSDFMSDYSPLKGFQFDLPKVARLSESEKTFLLMTESESADKNGIASPRHKITPLVQSQFEEATGKTFVSLFYQNFYNIQEIINLAIKYKKKVCIANPDQIPFFDRMAQIGDLVIPNEMRISASEISQNASKDVVVLVTGSGDQLYKYCKEICYGSVNGIHVDTKDTWIDAAPSVPGTEVSYTDASDTIFRTDCKVITLNRKSLVSMHAQEEDLKMMISLFRPKYYMPVKGEFRLLMANAKLAIDLGIGLNHFNTFVYDNGMALAFDNQGKVVRKMIVVKNGVTLTVAGTLQSESTAQGIVAESMFAKKAVKSEVEPETNASAIVVTGTLKVVEVIVYETDSPTTTLASGSFVSGAYYSDGDYNYVTPLATAVSADVLPTIIKGIGVYGAVTEGDTTFAATDDCDTITVYGQLTLSSLALSNEARHRRNRHRQHDRRRRSHRHRAQRREQRQDRNRRRCPHRGRNRHRRQRTDPERRRPVRRRNRHRRGSDRCRRRWNPRCCQREDVRRTRCRVRDHRHRRLRERIRRCRHHLRRRGIHPVRRHRHR